MTTLVVRFTITKVELDPRGFWTANISDGTDTVKVDNRIGIWSTPRDPRADHGATDVTRGEVLPELAKRLRERVRAAEAGVAQDESDIDAAPPAPPVARKTFRDVEPAPRARTSTERIAAEMAKAGAAAIKEAA
jgi:hypothetical protein